MFQTGFPSIIRSTKLHIQRQAFVRTLLLSCWPGWDVPSRPDQQGTAVAQWLRCCATNRKVAGSIPDGVIGIFH